MKIAVKYTIFALIATASNLLTQEISMTIYDGRFALYIAIMAGTGVGLVVKYALDKTFIFFYQTRSSAHNAWTFFLYTSTGVFTTVIFWGSELLFNYIWDYQYSKYVGAIIGLGIGYLCKYQLDKKMVFINANDESLGVAIKQWRKK